MRQEMTEDDLRDSLSMYEDLVSNIPVGVYRFRMKAGGGWQFDFVNSRFCELTGLNREDVLNNYKTVFSVIHPADLPAFISLMESVEKTLAPFTWAGRLICHGETRWMSVESSPTLMANGDILWSGYLNDITDRKRAEDSLRESEKRWKFALEGARDGVWDWNAQTNEVFFSKQWQAMLGYQEHEIGTTLDEWEKRLHPDDVERCYADLKRHFAGETPFYENEHRILCKDGSYKWILDRGKVIEWADDGKPLRVIGTHTDITERKKAEDALRESEQRFRLFYESSPLPYQSLDVDGRFIEINQAWLDMMGYERSAVIGKWFGDFLVPEHAELFRQRFLRFLELGKARDVEFTMIHQSGRFIRGIFDGNIGYDKDGTSVQTHCVIRDITEYKRIEDALRESEERFRGMFESHSAVMLLVEPDTGRIVLANNAAERFYGYTASQLVSMCIQDINILPPEEVEIERNFALCQRRNHFIFPHRLANGEVRTVEVHSSPIEHNGKVMLFSIIHDITKRLELEERLRHNQIMLARTERIAQIGSWEWEVATDSVTWSDELFRIFQLDPTRGAPSFEEHSSIYTPDSMARLREAVGLALSDGIPYELELQGIRSDGKTRHLRASGFPERTPDGRTSYLFGSLNDITDRKRFEEERLEMERKLLHTQKLESLGVMAAGIAHDFNNQLAVVLGNLELALTDQTLDPETLLSIESAIRAAKRSAELSRQMQVYTGNIVYFPVDLDLNEFLNRNLAQLKSIVSKHVALNFETNSTLPIVKGDAEQLQRLVMNILVNASEAIADKDGNVTIRTGFMDCDAAYLGRSLLKEKPAPGPFVFLEVTDTGCGMDVMTQHRIFDPFFTTKFCGRGLGMAEVIGIVKSHRGAIMVESEIGKGTAIRVLFPVSKEAQPSSVTDSMVSEPKDAVCSTAARRKTILVVEDEAGVRDLVVRRLGLLGYDSIIAEDGEEGVSVFRERMNKIDLVMLDYKMPKMNGVEAFGELIRIQPDVKVILSSGYTEDVVMESFPGQRPGGVLHKPYDMANLKDQLDILLGTKN